MKIKLLYYYTQSKFEFPKEYNYLMKLKKRKKEAYYYWMKTFEEL